MTDGIIQHVFKYRIKRLELDSKNAPDRIRNSFMYDNDLTLLRELQQELIEKIKQELQSDDDITIRLVVRKLIGDNQK